MPFSLLALAALALCSTASALQKFQFTQFYPEYRQIFTKTITNNCSTVFQQYLSSPPGLLFNPSCTLVFNCLVANTQELIKSDMASSSVVLGLMPTILSLLGTTTPELALLSSRRPLLAFFLSIGSPPVNPIRAFDYHQPIEALKHGKSLLGGKFQLKYSRLIVLLELIATGAAFANIWTVTLQLGQWTVISTGCGFIWKEMIWVGSAVVIHLFGTLAFSFRTKVEHSGSTTSGTLVQRLIERLKRWTKSEFASCGTQTKHTLIWQSENVWFLGLSWWASMATIAHIVYGTSTFSSATFIGMSLKLTFP
jgi:hypothetical protein